MSFLLAVIRGILNFIYLFHKPARVRDRISFISRQNPVPLPDVRLLADELKRQAPDTEIIISCRMIGPGFSGKLRYFLHMITKQMHLFATSKAIILDGYCIAACVLKHKKNLKIFQMWHAMGALKKFGYAAIGEEEGTSEAVAEGMRMHKGYSALFVGSSACKKDMAQAFGCAEDIIQVMPLPRADLIRSPEFNEENRKKIYEEYPEIKGKKVILYAPTFRKGKDMAPYVRSLEEAVDFEKYALIIKLHPLDSKNISSKKAIADNSFSTMKMLSCADYIVTDYSAVVFEAALAGKPVFRYVPDLEEYGVRRGLFGSYGDVPGFESENAREIMDAIEKEDFSPDDIRAFSEKYTAAEGCCTGKMAEFILASLLS